jgi:DNA-binding NtrC family response regulator
MTDRVDNILIVDDEESIRRVLSKKLSNEGYACVQAADAGQALNELAKNEYSMVILGINMPGKTGIELLPEIKTAFPYTQVLMATANTDLEMAIQCIKNGAYDYITKPFNLEEFIISVKRALMSGLFDTFLSFRISSIG